MIRVDNLEETTVFHFACFDSPSGILRKTKIYMYSHCSNRRKKIAKKNAKNSEKSPRSSLFENLPYPATMTMWGALESREEKFLRWKNSLSCGASIFSRRTLSREKRCLHGREYHQKSDLKKRKFSLRFIFFNYLAKKISQNLWASSSQGIF